LHTVCTLLPCSIVLFSAVNVYVFYEQINDDDDDFSLAAEYMPNRNFTQH